MFSSKVSVALPGETLANPWLLSSAFAGGLWSLLDISNSKPQSSHVLGPTWLVAGQRLIADKTAKLHQTITQAPHAVSPANVQQFLEEKAKKGNPTPHQKHATPAAASLQAMDGEAVQGSLRPEILSEDCTSGQLA